MTKQRRSMVLAVLPLVGALIGVTGCNGQGAAEEETAAAASKIEAAADAPAKRGAGAKHHGMRGMKGRHGPGMGPGFLLGAALHELDLTDAQRATIQGELDAMDADRPAPPDERAFEAHRAALAAAIRAGKIDEAALSAVPAPKERDTARVAKAVDALHATLTADQRRQLVDAVNAKVGEREGRMGERGFGRGGHDAKMRGPMGHLLEGIDLKDAQREKVREALDEAGDREAMKARHEAMAKEMKDRLQTFAGDVFDAKAFVAMPEHTPMFGPARMVKGLALVVPILDEAQRAELAKRVEAGPPRDAHDCEK